MCNVVVDYWTRIFIIIIIFFLSKYLEFFLFFFFKYFRFISSYLFYVINENEIVIIIIRRIEDRYSFYKDNINMFLKIAGRERIKILFFILIQLIYCFG